MVRAALATINRRSCYETIVFLLAALFISNIKTIIFSYYGVPYVANFLSVPPTHRRLFHNCLYYNVLWVFN